MSQELSTITTYTYLGAAGEVVPEDTVHVVIGPEVNSIRAHSFRGRASLISVVFADSTSIATIEDYAFESCVSLKEIVIPESTLSLGEGVFSGCKSLTSVVIPKAITSIHAYTFNDCESLESVSILGAVTTIGKNAFFRCFSLRAVGLPSTVEVIGEFAFSKCFTLQSFEIPLSVKILSCSCFHKCLSLETVFIPESVEKIAWGAFAECKSLTSLDIPSSVTTIGDFAFIWCSSLVSVALPKTNDIGLAAFSRCSSLLSVTIPEGLNTIGKDLFEGCTSLMSVTIPKSVTSIGSSAFQDCRSLSSVTLPSCIKSIGDHSFEGCSALSSIYIPESVEVIGNRAFADCRQLEIGADDCASDVALWLRYRTNGRYLHQICHRADVTKELISSCLENQPGSANVVDSLGMSPLHVLLMNEMAQPDMVEELLKANPDAVSGIAPLARYPLHLSCINPNLPLSVIEKLSNSYTKDGRLILTVPDENKSLPCALAIRCKRSDDIVLHLFERNPINASNLRTKDEVMRLQNIRNQYINQISRKSEASIHSFDSLQRHGWVSFVMSVDDGSDAAKQCARFIEVAGIHLVHALAYLKDPHGRQAIQCAISSVRQAMEQRILIFGRYELQRGPAISKSPKSCVLKVIDRRASDEYGNAFEMALLAESNNEQNRCIGENGFRTFLHRLGVDISENVFQEALMKWESNPNAKLSEEQCVALCTKALDNGQPREVALKFMSDTVLFRREIDLRDKLRLDSEYVVFINNHYSFDTHEQSFLNALNVIKDEGGIEYGDYKHAIAMPLADSNLDTIFRSERPTPTETRLLAKQLAEAVLYIHDKGIIHGSLTSRNVVRIGGRLRLIDFGAAVELGSFFGASFSSGVLPPEMIAKLTVEECRRFDKYFKEWKIEDPIGWDRIDPKSVDESSYYAVKTFRCHEVPVSNHEEGDEETTFTEYTKFEPIIDANLPYNLTKAIATLDIWSFGVLLFSLHTGSSLLEVNRDDDLASGEAMRELYEWNESKKRTKLKKVHDPLARRLLRRILSRDPLDRYQSMDMVLEDEYFVARWLPELSDEMSCVSEDAIRRATIELRNPKREILESIGRSASATLTTLFDAIEVKSPVCFIILPYKCKPRPKEGNETSESSAAPDYLEHAYAYIEFVLDTVLKCLSYPDSTTFASEFVQSPLVSANMHLYLVDESTGESVCMDSVYPLRVDLRSVQVRTFLPLMAMGIQAVAARKFAVGVMNMFLPGVPSNQIPRRVWAQVEAFVSQSNKTGFISQSLTDDVTVTSDGRASEFREFLGYLTENDVMSSLGGMRRICDKSTEKGMWVTEENAQAIESGSDNVWQGTTENVVDGCCSVS